MQANGNRTLVCRLEILGDRRVNEVNVLGRLIRTVAVRGSVVCTSC
jgi:hypothetical protein